MNRTLIRYMITGGILVSIAGFVMHFIYDWSGQNPLIGLVAPVNESVWEHMKLLFFPMLVYGIIGIRTIGKTDHCLESGMLAGLLLGTLLIPILFYGYTGLLGSHNLWLDIGTFLVSTAIAFLAAYRLTLSCRATGFIIPLKILTLAMTAAFFLFTYFPPDLSLFQS